MGKLSFGRVLDRFCISSGAGGSCLCFNNYTNQDDLERKPFITPDGGQLVRLKDVITGPPTLALQLKPKVWTLSSAFHHQMHGQNQKGQEAPPVQFTSITF